MAGIFHMEIKQNINIVARIFTVPQILRTESLSDGNFNMTYLSEKEGYLRFPHA